MYHFDFYISYTAFTTAQAEELTRFAQIAFLLEPHVVLWAYHFLVPWIEYGTKVGVGTQRVSTGINYYFYVRPWSVRMGFGVAYDNMFSLPEPQLEWTIFRALTSLVFYL